MNFQHFLDENGEFTRELELQARNQPISAFALNLEIEIHGIPTNAN